MIAKYFYKNAEIVAEISAVIKYEGDIIIYPTNKELDAIRITEWKDDDFAADRFLELAYDGVVCLCSGNSPQYEFMKREKASELLVRLQTE